MSDTEAKSEWQRVENTDIYHRTSNGTYYERPCINGVRTFRSLKTKNLKDAKAEWKRRETCRAAGNDPQPKPNVTTVGECIKLYQTDGYPDKQRGARPETMRKAEAANCVTLLEFWNTVQVDAITIAECDRYRDWRVKRIRRKGAAGNRSVDLEINTLRNSLLWAARKEVIRHMPMPAGWPTYCSDKTVQHCREFMPADANELHRIARMLFSSRQSESLGFQMLFEAYTGQRTAEILELQANAGADAPGGLTPDGQSLRVTRAKGQDMVNPYAFVHDGLRDLLKSWTAWKGARHPKSPWYFPGRTSETPVSKCALAHALRRLRKRIGKRVIPHGLRAFYVTVRRSNNIRDTQIAFEIGHTSGGKTLAEVYGGCPPHWLTGEGPKMKWLPDGEPAWTALKLPGHCGA